jgi:hypothetical protein
MGIFTAGSLKKGESILPFPDGPSITLLTNKVGGIKTKFPEGKSWRSVWGEYAWGRGRGVPDHVNYEGNHVMDFQITTGALPNNHCLLDAITYRYPNPAYDDSLVSNRASPGTGAFSYNQGRDFYVYRDVEAGEELFLHYGRCRHDNHPSWAEGFPMPIDYEIAVKFMQDIYKKTEKLSFVQAQSYPIKTPNQMEETTSMIIPKTLSELRTIIAGISTSKIIQNLAKKDINQRTPDWLRKHGKCLENMMPGKSLLPDAGRGAFAQFDIAEGEIVVPAPMIHVIDRDALAILDKDGNQVGVQLLINYCFGHRESSLLLCPNTNAVLINHCSKRWKSKCTVNAEIRWSDPGWDETSDSFRKMTLKDLATQPFRGLSADIVAIRHIPRGGEVFLDYGLDWEEAWLKHVNLWKPLPSMPSAKVVNDLKDPPNYLLSNDLREEVHHPHLFAGCQYFETKEDNNKVWAQRDPSWRNLTDEKILKKFARDGSKFVGQYSNHDDLSYWPCVIFRPKPNEDDDETYTVRILQQHFPDTKHQPWYFHDLPRILTKYPRKSIHFFVNSSDRDQLQEGVFRHHIGFPDEIFPEHWKNLKES